MSIIFKGYNMLISLTLPPNLSIPLTGKNKYIYTVKNKKLL